MPAKGKHECRFCGLRFERATEHSIHLTLDHKDRTSFVPYADRWKNRIYTCGQCYKLMSDSADSEYVKECAHCGHRYDLQGRRTVQ